MNTIAMSFLVLGLVATAPRSNSPAGWQGRPTPPAKPTARLVLVKNEGDKADKPAKKPRRNFTISKETTYVTGPVDEDGSIDYATALNQRMSRGVTPDNNANVLIWKALGPHPERATMPTEFFKWMGIGAPPERGSYFIDLGRYLNEHVKDAAERTDIIENQLDRAMKRPWTATDYPQLAAWLKANEKPLAVLMEATKRSHYFSPLVTKKTKHGSGGLIGALLPAAQKCRELASALAARAMLRVSQGEYDDAWQDLLAGHRLGRLVGRGASLIEGLVGIAIDQVATNAGLAYLQFARPSAKRLGRCQRDLQNLPALAPIADKVTLGERFMFLDVVMMVERGGIQTLEALAQGKTIKSADPKANPILGDIDWDPAMKTANRWYDRLVAALRLPDRPAREKKLRQMETELKTLKKNLVDSGELSEVLRDDKKSAAARGKAIGNILTSLLMPAVRKVQTAADRSGQVHANLLVAFALARYQRDHGRYPEKLGALAPKYLANVPRDVFSGKALVYRPTAQGYLLYSVGPNGLDEEGRGFDDQPRGDDLSVRMPLPHLP
jgi:hypothetical protein